jgi:hypothetical protein
MSTMYRCSYGGSACVGPHCNPTLAMRILVSLPSSALDTSCR